MATLVFSMNQSLDGYVDHTAFAPGPALFRHFITVVGSAVGSIYGRRMYEVMRYWDEYHPEWNEDARAFANAWRGQKKWVVSRTLDSVGPNATLLTGDLETAVRAVKAEHDGRIGVAGPRLAAGLSSLLDEYRMYLHPVVLGGGTPFFIGARPALRLVASDRMDESVIRLTYVPAP